MDDRTLLRIDTLLKHIDQIFDDIKNTSVEDLKKSNLLLRAVCFSIAQIGEMMSQLQEGLGEKYWKLPWYPAKKMRNIIVHDYGGTDVEQIYSTIRDDLPNLKKAFLAVRNDILFNALVTDNCVLRKVKKEDAEPMFRNWASDPEVTKFLTWPSHESIEVTNKVIDRWFEEEKNPKTIRFVITLKDNDEPIGSIDVVGYINDNPEIGYCLSRKYWNKGLMTEACKAFSKYLLNIGFEKVLIKAVVENIGSNRVIEKCGFKFTHQEHLEHQSSFKPNPVTLNCYELIK